MDTIWQPWACTISQCSSGDRPRCVGHALCLSWSPDGELLVTPKPIHNCGSVSQSVSPVGTQDEDFIAQRKATTYLRFNPVTLGKIPRTEEEEEPRQIVACASVGRQFTISDAIHLPMRHSWIFKYGSHVLDFSWSKDGYQLMVCSSDCSVAYLQFARCDIGNVYLDDSQPDDAYWQRGPSKTTNRTGKAAQ